MRVSIVTRSRCSSMILPPLRNQIRPMLSRRVNGRFRSQPNRWNGPQPRAAAFPAHPASRNRAQSSIKRSQRFTGTSAGGLLGFSRAKPSAQARGAPPSYSMMAAHSSWASLQVVWGAPLATIATPATSHSAGEDGATDVADVADVAEGRPSLIYGASHRSSAKATAFIHHFRV